MTEAKKKTVHLGGRDFEVQPILLRDVETMTPMLAPLSLELKKGLSISGDAMKALTTFVALGIKRGAGPEFTEEALRDLPVSLDELFEAFSVVVEHGLRLKKKEASDEGEARG